MNSDHSRDRVLKYAVWSLVAAYPVCVLFIRHSFTGAMLVFALAGTIIFFRDKKAGIDNDYKSESMFLKAGIAGIVFSVICLVANGDIANIKTPELEFFDKQFRFLFFVPFLILLRKTGMPEKPIWWGAAAAAAASGVYAITVKAVHPEIHRVSGGGNPINYGCFSLISAFISINGMFFFEKIKKTLGVIPPTYVPVAAFCLGFTGSVLSGSRGSWLALPFLLIITVIHFWIHKRLKRIFIITAAGLVCALLVSMAVDRSVVLRRVSEVDSAVKKYFDGIDDLATSKDIGFVSIGGRLEMYRVAIEMIKENPFFGVGPGRYQKEVTKRIETGTADRAIGIYQYPHNDYLTVASCCGIPGLVIFCLTAYLLPLHTVYRFAGKDRKQPLLWAGFILISGYMHFSVSNATLFKNIRLHYYYLMLAAIAVSMKSAEQEEKV
jgi:O-antigen ligase